MKRLLFFAMAALCVMFGATLFLHKEKPMGKYVHTDGFGLATDATQFVVSGEYYFDCQWGWLVRRTPLQLSADALRTMPGLQYVRMYDDELDAVYEPFFADPAWPEGFTYIHTYILKGPDVVITTHKFEKGILFDGKKYIMAFTQGVHMKSADIHIRRYDPETYMTYEQYLEQAKNSCGERQ